MPTGRPRHRLRRDRDQVAARRSDTRTPQRGTHRPQHLLRGTARGRAALLGASVVVAIGALATGGDVVVAGGAEPAATRAAAPPDLADRGAERASRDGRPTARRTGTVPSPNSATRAKPRPPQPQWVRPVRRYRMTSGFGARWGTLHAGVDLAGSTGTAIMAVRAGAVKEAGWYGGYGYAVIIDHGNGVSTLYGHNSRVLVRDGQRVRTGQRIALMGSTGYSTGPHLHLEVHLGEKPVNPVPWLRTRGVRL